MSALLALIVAAALAGLAGSPHCVAMCGGIATALDASVRPDPALAGARWRFPLAFHAGRMFSYALVGAGMGGAGAMASTLLAPANALRVGAAVVAIVFGVALLTRRRFALLDRAGLAAWRRIAPLARRVLPVRHARGAVLAGALWGWLPCGMVYAAAGMAALAGGALPGAAVMLAFGFGTVPAFGALATIGRGVRRQPRLAATLMIAVGFVSLATGAFPFGSHDHSAHAEDAPQAHPHRHH